MKEMNLISICQKYNYKTRQYQNDFERDESDIFLSEIQL